MTLNASQVVEELHDSTSSLFECLLEGHFLEVAACSNNCCCLEEVEVEEEVQNHEKSLYLKEVAVEEVEL